MYLAIGMMAFVGLAVVAGLVYFITRATTSTELAPPAPAPKVVVTPPAPVNNAPATPPEAPLPPAPPAPVVSKGPIFLDTIPLVGRNIVFSIDGGSSGVDSYDLVRQAVKKAVGTLQPDQHFIVAVWTESGLQRFPAAGWAAKSQLANVSRDFDNTGAYGASNAVECMKSSLQLGGDQTIFVTAKLDLTPDMAAPVLAVRKPGQRIDAVKITSEDADSPLGRMVNATGGKFIPKMDFNDN